MVTAQLFPTLLVPDLRGPGGRGQGRGGLLSPQGPDTQQAQREGQPPQDPGTGGGSRAPAGVGPAGPPVARTQDPSEGPIVTLREHFVPRPFIH